jgi:hypothetical protein
MASLSDLYRSFAIGRPTRTGTEPAAASTATTAEPATAPPVTRNPGGSGTSSGLGVVIDLQVRIRIQFAQNSGSAQADGTIVRPDDRHHGNGRSEMEQLRRRAFRAVKDALSGLGPLTEEERKGVRAALRAFAKDLRAAWRDARDAQETAETADTAATDVRPPRIAPSRSAIEAAFDTLLESLRKIFDDGGEATPEQGSGGAGTEPPRPAPNDPLARLPDLFATLLDLYEKWLGAPAPGDVKIPEDGMENTPAETSPPAEPVVAA